MSRTGRPRQFNREDALLRAMELFWAQGYEGATLADLQKAMGKIAAPSFYAAFGSKEELFKEAVEVYKDTEGAAMVVALMGGKTARSSIEGLLRASMESIRQPNKPPGCLLVTSAVNCMPSNESVQEFMREQRVFRKKALRQRLQRAVDEGDLAEATDLSALVSFYASVLDGMALSARDGASRKALKDIVDGAMAAWDSIIAFRE